MITHLTYRPAYQINVTPISNSNGVSRVFAAAIVNQQFCKLLLQDPYKAIQKGYLGETFSLSSEEYDLIVSAQAKSLSDLAKLLNRGLKK